MRKAGKKGEPSKKAGAKPKTPSPPPTAEDKGEDEDYEDGDIATPKRDRYGTDDEPL
ncbi:MAG TPA: hypothetical protein VKR55_12495 [Bradyrhizobium sp.]|uniref:hypothetical protein n=1 Tax=Bradyrhizobium sp. TaxID=376 RepID=UPI002C4095CC|nr:hypothetical protein [Bradyrhizobium sp.]HLZ02958.1 hypothetical protein [Bradyrhizobium sp.]